jgi:hypothetical protein
MTNDEKTFIIHFSLGASILLITIAVVLAVASVASAFIQSSAKPASVTAPTRPWLVQPDVTPFRPSVGSALSKEALLESTLGPVNKTAAQEAKQCGGIARARRTVTYRPTTTTTHRYTLVTPETTHYYQHVYKPAFTSTPSVAVVAPAKLNHPAIDPESYVDGTVALKEAAAAAPTCTTGTCNLKGSFSYPDIFQKVK